MSTDEILLTVEEKMEKAVDVLKNQLSGIRTGRATPGLVDSIKVDVYGSLTPLKQLATIGAPEPQQIVIRPYDAGTIKDIEKAIIASDLGLAPQSDGRVVRLNIPPLSAEVRKKMVSRIKELGEESKVSIRNIRRDGNKDVEKAEKDKAISEDQRDDAKEQIQEFTKTHEAKVAEMMKSRESDVMED